MAWQVLRARSKSGCPEAVTDHCALAWVGTLLPLRMAGSTGLCQQNRGMTSSFTHGAGAFHKPSTRLLMLRLDAADARNADIVEVLQVVPDDGHLAVHGADLKVAVDPHQRIERPAAWTAERLECHGTVALKEDF
jgi:hypothetical protein